MKNNNYLSTKIAGYTGFFIQAVVNNFLPVLFIALQDIYKLSYEQLGNLILLNFVTQIGIDVLTAPLSYKLGYKKTTILSQFIAFLGLALLGFLPNLMNPYAALVICIIVYAIGSGITEVIISPIIEILPTKNKKKNMAVLHSFYCWGQAVTVLVTTLLVSVFGYGKWNLIPLIWSVIPFINTLLFIAVPVIEPTAEQKNAKLSPLIKNKKFLIFMVMMLCGGASEIAMSQWASIFVQNALGVSKVIGDISGPCGFAVAMGIGRILYGKYAEKIAFEKVIILLGSLCFGCYITVAVSKVAVLGLIGCALCGFAASAFWPGVLSEGARNFKNSGALMFSVLALCGDSGCSIGPWVIGAVADEMTLNMGMALASIFPVIIILCGLCLLKINSCKTAK